MFEQKCFHEVDCSVSKCSLTMHKLRTRLPQGVTTEEQVFIVDMKESIARGVWRKPEKREKVID